MELEKSITKEASGQKQQQTAKRENKTSQKTSTNKKFKVPFAKKNSEEKIPTEKVSFSSAEMANTLGQKNTTLEKSSGVQDDKKLCADNTIPLNSPINVVRLKNIGTMSLKDLVDFHGIEQEN